MDLTDDEAGMLYWLREFPNKTVVVDDTVRILITKGLVNDDDGIVRVSAAGILWPELNSVE